MILAQQVGKRRGGKKRQQGGFYDSCQFGNADEFSDKVQDGGNDKKGAGNAPQGRVTHGYLVLVPAS
jgi:hypothetical protein